MTHVSIPTFASTVELTLSFACVLCYLVSVFCCCWWWCWWCEWWLWWWRRRWWNCGCCVGSDCGNDGGGDDEDMMMMMMMMVLVMMAIMMTMTTTMMMMMMMVLVMMAIMMTMTTTMMIMMMMMTTKTVMLLLLLMMIMKMMVMIMTIYAGHWTSFNMLLMMYTRVNPDAYHDDVIKWKHFPRHWPFVRGIHRSPVNSPHKGQWRGALMFSLICVWINGWVNNGKTGDLRRYRARYDVIVMFFSAYHDQIVVSNWRWRRRTSPKRRQRNT